MGVRILAKRSGTKNDPDHVCFIAIGSIINASVSIVSAVIFLVYGSLLVNMVVESGKQSGGSGGGVTNKAAARRMYVSPSEMV